MSPNAYLHVGKDGFMHGYAGEDENEKPVFTWTYDVFGDDVTPSMYDFMTDYVYQNISKEELYEIQGGDYCPCGIEDDAVDAYYDLPALRKLDMHKTMLANLKESKKEAEDRLKAARELVPLNFLNPLAQEYNTFIDGLVTKYGNDADYIQEQIELEEEWRGGFEEDSTSF